MGSRILVQRAIYKNFLSHLVDKTNLIRLGDPLSQDTQMGPVISRTQLERVESFVDQAVQRDGATIATGGTKISASSLGGKEGKGYYYAPTILTDVTPDMACWKEEIFGPV